MSAQTADTGWRDVARKVSAPDPNGTEQQLGLNDVFFSTTDRKGVIEQANEVFVRISRYPREVLVGSPHNIIRHPVMPGAAFRAMWDYLLDDQPFVAYVHNLAADGSLYTVLATVTPLDGGFLSVRTRPERADLLGAADSIYGTVRHLELEWEAAGLGAPAAAAQGLGVLAKQLTAAGIPDYTAFMQTVLPAEVQARIAAGATVPQRPWAVGRLADMAVHQRRLTEELDDWVSLLGRLDELATQLSTLSGELAEHSHADAALRERIQQAKQRAEGFSPIMAGLDLWSAMTLELSTLVAKVTDEVEQLRASCAATRFRIALARLHCDQVGYFTVELIDQTPDWQLAAPGIVLLCRALSQGVAETAGAVQGNAQLAAKVASDINEMAQAVSIPRTLLASWQTMAAGRELSDDLRELMPQVGSTIETTAEQIERIGRVAEECRRNAQPHDITAIREHVMALSEAASVVAAESAPTPHADPQPVDSPEVDRQYDEPPAPPSETVAPAAGAPAGAPEVGTPAGAPGSGVPDAGQPGGEQSPVPSPTFTMPVPPDTGMPSKLSGYAPYRSPAQQPATPPAQAFPPPPVQQPFRPEQFPPPQAPMGR